MTYKFIISPICLIAFCAASLTLFAQDPAAASGATMPPPPDFGDHSSQTLTSKAWNALGAKNYAHVLAYTGKCISLYLAEALAMQAGLTAPAPAETASSLWALNDVGACYYIRGMAYEGMGKSDLAKADYKKLLEKLAFAQVWDPKGWFWKPADAARQRLEVIAFDTL